MADPLTKDEKPHYAGHRDRLRQRFLDAPDALPDYELLELILFMAIPRRDVKPIAKILITRFGSFNGVVNASVPDLCGVKGISENTAIAIKAIRAGAMRMMKQDVIGKPVLNSWQRLMDYLHATMAHEKKEHFRLLFLNKKNELIADEVQQSGTVDHTPAYPREIMKRALELSATAIILVHNHPSGDPTPSQADVDMTNAIIAAAQPFNIVIHDHLIVSKSDITSFKTLGLI
ncbi:MAG: DNA repair protein RadC [Pseudomonadota bacterium]